MCNTDVIQEPDEQPDPIFIAVYHVLTKAKEHGLETEVIAEAFAHLGSGDFSEMEPEEYAAEVETALLFSLNEWIK